MSNPARTINLQHALNHSLPTFKQARLGDRLNDFINSHNSSMLIPAALAQKAGNLTLVTGQAALANVGGSTLNNGIPLVPIANATSMPALVGSIPTGSVGLWAFYIDNGGNITQQFVVAATVTAALTAFPNTLSSPVPTCLIGFMTVANATGSNFVGGTTALNAGSVTTTIYSITGNFNNMVALQNSNGRPLV